MPIDQELNKILKEMWRLNEEINSGNNLTESEINFYNIHLKDIKEYYSRNNNYWSSVTKIK